MSKWYSAGIWTRRRSVAKKLPILVFGVLLATLSLAGAGQAQSVDWLVNIDDAGFDPIGAGGTIEYSIDVTNNGYGNAPANTLTLEIPADTEMTGVGPGGTITNCSPLPAAGPATVTCEVPPLAGLQVASVVALVQTSTDGVVAMVAEAANPGGVDSSTTNNRITENTTITAGSDIAVALVVPASAPLGGFVDFEITATNNGPDTAESFNIEFPVPPGIANVTPPSGCSLAANIYTCAISGPVAPGASVVRTFNGQIAVTDGSDVAATGSVSGADPVDSIATNNTDDQVILVTPGTDLAVEITRGPGGTILTGDPVDFTISSSYTGENPNGISISYDVPTNYQIDSIIAPANWTCGQVGQLITCDRPSGSGSSEVDFDLGDIVVKTTTVSQGNPISRVAISAASPTDSNALNDEDSLIVPIVDPKVDLEARKAGPNPPLAVVNNPTGAT